MPWYTDEPVPYGGGPGPYEIGGFHGLPLYRPSLEVVRKKVSLAWDRRITAPVSRPGSWSSDPWLGDKAVADDAGWDLIELGKVAAPSNTHPGPAFKR